MPALALDSRRCLRGLAHCGRMGKNHEQRQNGDANPPGFFNLSHARENVRFYF